MGRQGDKVTGGGKDRRCFTSFIMLLLFCAALFWQLSKVIDDQAVCFWIVVDIVFIAILAARVDRMVG